MAWKGTANIRASPTWVESDHRGSGDTMPWAIRRSSSDDCWPAIDAVSTDAGSKPKCDHLPAASTRRPVLPEKYTWSSQGCSLRRAFSRSNRRKRWVSSCPNQIRRTRPRGGCRSPRSAVTAKQPAAFHSDSSTTPLRLEEFGNGNRLQLWLIADPAVERLQEVVAVGFVEIPCVLSVQGDGDERRCPRPGLPLTDDHEP